MNSYQKFEMTKEFGAKLKAMLEQKGWGNESLYAIAGRFNTFAIDSHKSPVAPSAFVSWANGKCLPQPHNFQKLVDWLGCEKHDLLPEKYLNILGDCQ